MSLNATAKRPASKPSMLRNTWARGGHAGAGHRRGGVHELAAAEVPAVGARLAHALVARRAAAAHHHPGVLDRAVVVEQARAGRPYAWVQRPEAQLVAPVG